MSYGKFTNDIYHIDGKYNNNLQTLSAICHTRKDATFFVIIINVLKF